MGTRTKIKLEFLTRTISAIRKFRENIMENSLNVCKTTPWAYIHKADGRLTVKPCEVSKYLALVGYKHFSPHCCKCSSFGRIAAIRRGSACHGLDCDNVYSGTEHNQFDSPRLVKREAGGGRWLAQPNYDAIMTRHTTENSGL